MLPRHERASVYELWTQTVCLFSSSPRERETAMKRCLYCSLSVLSLYTMHMYVR